MTSPVMFAIPSPGFLDFSVGPLTLRMYALCIIAGAVLAIWIGERRFVARGGRSGAILDVAVWAIPFGIVGARLYHVITDADRYFGTGAGLLESLGDAAAIWNGGLGIWGGIAGGALGAWIACRRYRLPFGAVADVLAPGLLVAQAVGRLGNWFNQELYGRETDLPWGLQIDQAHRVDPYRFPYDPDVLFHPTFLYEALWNLAGAAALVWIISRWIPFGHGRLLAAYVMIYTAGRGWIETLRIDPANEFGGLRLNVYTSVVAFALAGLYLWWTRHQREPVALDAESGVEVPADDDGSAVTADESTVVADESTVEVEETQRETRTDDT